MVAAEAASCGLMTVVSNHSGLAEVAAGLARTANRLRNVGAQGQGVNSVGEICAKGLKRAGYCVFGYREYMSLIKGGHSSYQLDVSHENIESSETTVHVLVTFNHHGLERNVCEVKDGGIIVHQAPHTLFPKSSKNDDHADVRKILFTGWGTGGTLTGAGEIIKRLGYAESKQLDFPPRRNPVQPV